MKIKIGFISNSSSSSFVIFGRTYSIDTIAKKANINTEDEDYDCENLYEFLDKTNLTYHSDHEDGCYYIGLPLININDNETFAQFKKRVKKEVIEKFGDEKDGSPNEEFVIIDAVIGTSGELEW